MKCTKGKHNGKFTSIHLHVSPAQLHDEFLIRFIWYWGGIHKKICQQNLILA